MTRAFRPRMDILPPAQQRLWPALRNAPALGFTLYGGTAIALRLGHRASVDFDFFSERPLNREAIRAAFPFIAASTTLQDQSNTWSVMTPADSAPANDASGDHEARHVKISFFGAIGFGRVGDPEMTDDGIVQVASLDDLMATKLKVVVQCAEAKDYRDIAAMIESGVSLPRGLAFARLLFGPNFQPSESLKALVYFEDGDLNTLSAAEKKMLVAAVKAVHDLPDVTLRAQNLGLATGIGAAIVDPAVSGQTGSPLPEFPAPNTHEH